MCRSLKRVFFFIYINKIFFYVLFFGFVCFVVCLFVCLFLRKTCPKLKSSRSRVLMQTK